MTQAQRVVVGVAGGSASGKTTLVRALQDLLQGITTFLLHHDDYYLDQRHLPPPERARLNFDRPAALDNRRLARHLRALREGQAVHSPTYCFRTHSRLSETRRIEPAEVIVVEGMLLLAVRTLRELLDVRVFVDTPADLRLARRLRRDVGPERDRTVASVLDQYETFVRPMHARYVEPSKAFADLIVTDATDARQVARAARLIKRRLQGRTPAASCTRPHSASRP